MPDRPSMPAGAVGGDRTPMDILGDLARALARARSPAQLLKFQKLL